MVGTVAKVSGTSMQPTLNAAEYPQRTPFFLDHVFINRMAARRHSYQRGDVVTLWSPEKEGTVLIKRVVGCAGDWVRVPVTTCTLPRALAWPCAALPPSPLRRPMHTDGTVLLRVADGAQPPPVEARATRPVLGGRG